MVKYCTNNRINNKSMMLLANHTACPSVHPVHGTEALITIAMKEPLVEQWCIGLVAMDDKNRPNASDYGE